MKKHTLCLLTTLALLSTCLLPLNSFGQCYSPRLNGGIKEYNAKNYDAAITVFNSAKSCADKPSDGDKVLNEWIGKCLNPPSALLKCKGCAENGADLYISEALEVDEGNFTWEEAINKCRDKGAGWYLPTVNELFCIIDEQSKGFYFESTYWSSSNVTSSQAYAVSPVTRLISPRIKIVNEKNKECLVRCVRKAN